jgi:hypothetical protein
MICQIIIQDCLIDRRMVYMLEDSDFAFQHSQRDMRLPTMPLFAGKTCWHDLDVSHYHTLIMTMLNTIAGKTDDERGDRLDAAVTQLTFFLCGMVVALQNDHSTVELLRITRLSPTDLLYDYTASMQP